MMANDAALTAALMLAETLGFSVFPCHANKAPANPHGFKDASKDADKIRLLWRSYPGPLIGIATGEASGVDVFDVDIYKPEGEAWFAEHCAQFPTTFHYMTERGGIHFYFWHRNGLRCKIQKTQGFDVKGDGGYVVYWAASPCATVFRAPIAEWPDCLLEIAATQTLGVGVDAEPVSQEALKAVDPDALAAIVAQLPNGKTFDDRTAWVTLAHAIAGAFPDDPARAEELWLHHAGKRAQKEDEPERVWRTLSGPHKAGANYIVARAREAGVDTSAYDAAVVALAFKAAGALNPDQSSAETPDLLPDMSILRLGRRAPPPFPLAVLGDTWGRWVVETAAAAACPVDNVAAPLLAAASALIGHARWAQAAPGWAEPPHLWLGVVGDSGTGKSPGADALLRDVLPELERRMLGDFPDRLAQWRVDAEAHAAAIERWKLDVRTAQKEGSPAPMPPIGAAPAEPQAPRLRQNDVTIEKVAALLAGAAPKGLLMVRDELSGWLLGLNAYNDAGRPFWIEAYGGRPYRVERQKHPEPIVIPRLAVAVTGGTQPEKLAAMFAAADDGLLARIAWVWPNALPFRLGRTAPATDWAISSLDRLRLLDLVAAPDPAEPPRPLMVPLVTAMQREIEALGQEMQRLQDGAGGLMRSAYGKARGLVLRFALV